MNPFESFFENLLKVLKFFVESPNWIILAFIFFICIALCILVYWKWIPKLKNEEIEKINSEYSRLEKVCTDRVDSKIIDIVQIGEYHFYPVVSFEYRGQRYSSQLKQYILFNIPTEPDTNKSSGKTNRNYISFTDIFDIIIIFLDALRNLGSPLNYKISVSDLYYKMGNTLPICINPLNLNEVYSPLLLNELRYHLDTNPLRNKKLYFLEFIGAILGLITIILGIIFITSFYNLFL